MLSNVENFIRNIFSGKTAGVQTSQDPEGVVRHPSIAPTGTASIRESGVATPSTKGINPLTERIVLSPDHMIGITSGNENSFTAAVMEPTGYLRDYHFYYKNGVLTEVKPIKGGYQTDKNWMTARKASGQKMPATMK